MRQCKINFKYFVVLFFLAVGFLSFSNARAEEEEGGAKPAEGAGKAAEKKKGTEWADLNTQLATLKAKIKMSEDTIEKLIIEKKETTDEKKSSEVIKNLIQEHKSLEATVDEYEQKRNQLRYRFPEGGLAEDREYERVEVRSLQQMESEMSIEGRLKKAFSRVKSQYRNSYEQIPKKKRPEKKTESENSAGSESSTGSEDRSKVKSSPSKTQGDKENRLAEPTILSK